MLKITDSSGTVHYWFEKEYKFFHQGSVCRVYHSEKKETLASFTNPISVIRK